MESVLLKVKPKLDAGKRVDSSTKKGVTEKPLFSAIPLKNYLVPILHVIDLFVNTVKKMFDVFVDVRLENRPIEVTCARWDEADKIIAERKRFLDLEEAEDIVSDLRARNASEEDIIPAKVGVMDAEEGYSKAKKARKESTRKLKSLLKKKKYGAVSQEVRQELDAVLHKQFHILRSSYHGCDMEGNFCRKLVANNAEEVMNAVKEVLLRVPRSQRAAGCDDDEIQKYCDATQRLFEYMNVVSHFVYQPPYLITDDEMRLVEEVVDRMDRLWDKLSINKPPKVHAWRHLIENLCRLRGMLYHQEAKIKLVHQAGRQMDMRVRALASQIDKKIACMMQWLANREDPVAKAEHAIVMEDTKRKFSEETLDKRASKQHEKKRLKETDVADILSLPKIKSNFKTLRELTVDDRLVAAFEAVDDFNIEINGDGDEL